MIGFGAVADIWLSLANQHYRPFGDCIARLLCRQPLGSSGLLRPALRPPRLER